VVTLKATFVNKLAPCVWASSNAQEIWFPATNKSWSFQRRYYCLINGGISMFMYMYILNS